MKRSLIATALIGLMSFALMASTPVSQDEAKTKTELVQSYDTPGVSVEFTSVDLALSFDYLIEPAQAVDHLIVDAESVIDVIDFSIDPFPDSRYWRQDNNSVNRSKLANLSKPIDHYQRE